MISTKPFILYRNYFFMIKQTVICIYRLKPVTLYKLPVLHIVYNNMQIYIYIYICIYIYIYIHIYILAVYTMHVIIIPHHKFIARIAQLCLDRFPENHRHIINSLSLTLPPSPSLISLRRAIFLSVFLVYFHASTWQSPSKSPREKRHVICTRRGRVWSKSWSLFPVETRRRDGRLWRPFSGSPAATESIVAAKWRVGARPYTRKGKELPVGRKSTVARNNYLFEVERRCNLSIKPRRARCRGVENPLPPGNNDSRSFVSRVPPRSTVAREYFPSVSGFSDLRGWEGRERKRRGKKNASRRADVETGSFGRDAVASCN